MLTEIQIENFKRFGGGVLLPCRRLNLLTGTNSQGKSTALQPLLVLSQSIVPTLARGGALRHLELNGDHVNLGTFREVQNKGRTLEDPIRLAFELTEGGTSTIVALWLQQSDGAERRARIVRRDVERYDGAELELSDSKGPEPTGLLLPVSGSTSDPAEAAIGHVLASLGRVHYVSADRLGPQDFFPRHGGTEFLSVGVRGENCADVLHRARRDQLLVVEALERPEARAPLTVEDQTSAWLSYLFDGAKVKVDEPHSTILTLEMNSDGSANYVRPVNIGFGYSYALPILVAGLIAKPAEILIVENPEAHLHPLAQSRIAEFLARVAGIGVQVFVESHSEHVLNAFRLALRERRVRNADDLCVLYFSADPNVPFRRVVVEEDGSISNWPDGFFDQRLRDFTRLFGGD